MILNFMLIVGDTVVSRAKTPATLDYSKVSGVWSVCRKCTETNGDDGCTLPLAVIDCSNGTRFQLIMSDDAGLDDHTSFVERCNVVDIVRAELQKLFDAGRLSDYNDPPAIRVIPYKGVK